MPPVLFADRFYLARPGQALDLATGARVWIRTVTFGDARVRERWLAWAAAISAISHPQLVALADYGPIGKAADFEAWECPPPPRAQRCPRDPTAALGAVNAFLGAQGLHGIEFRRSDAVDLDGRVAFRPRMDMGVVPDDTPADHGGTVAAERELDDVAERLADVLAGGVSGRPRAVRFSLSSSAVVKQAARAIARCSRLHGYVPVSARLLGAPPPEARAWRTVVAGRHVVVLSTPDDIGLAGESALFFLELGLASDRPHVLLTLRAPGTERLHTPCRPGSTLRVAEESAPYSGDAVIARWTPTLVGRPCTGEVAPDLVRRAAAVGRHAQVERWLRDAEGRCARRHDDAGAGEAMLALGRLFLWRGRLSNASRAFEDAHRHFEAAGLGVRAVCAAVFAGLSLTDGGRFGESEAALRAAAVAAGALHDDPTHLFAVQALVRCLVWQGRFDEAIERLGHAAANRGERSAAADPSVAGGGRMGMGDGPRRLSGDSVAVRERPAAFGDGWPINAIDPAVIHSCLLARAAIGAGDLGAAGRATAEARARAGATGNALDAAAACRARALLFAALGDLAATREQVDEGLEAARRAHDPLRAIRLRLVLADALIGERRECEARQLLARLSRLDARRLPAVVSRPLERLLRGEGSDRHGRSAVGGRPPGPPPTSPGEARTKLTDAVVEVLGVCQSVEDEREALRKVAAILRARVRAASVACFAGEDGRASVVVQDGANHPAEAVAARAVDSGLTIPPTSTRTGLEAAVPIRFGGLVIGAWACRWAADEPPDWGRCTDLFTAAAAAVASSVSGLLDRRATPPPDAGPGQILGISDAVRTLRAEIARAAPAPFNVVIEGESGSGKELVARAIHRLGPRAHRTLCALNCAALTDELIEAELFGHARGAFTGAMTERRGLFEEAHQGTLVLDEVGELTPRAQAKLLRAVQEGEVRRLGENLPRAVDVRIVAATNRSLRASVASGAFRPDLLYRLEVIRIVVPPLRARIEDIPILAAHFWREAAARVGSRCTLSTTTLAALARYEWPGNVRELQNVMAALAVGAGRRGSVGPGSLPAVIGRQAASDLDARNLEEARRLFEAGFVRAALARAGGRRAQAAADLGLTRQGLAKLLARLGIE